MKLRPTSLAGTFLVEISAIQDDRGLFARTYDAAQFAEAGLPTHWPQSNVSWNRQCGTLRGMHFQADPKPEPKLVRCTHGRVFDVVVDLRPGSPTLRHWFAVELTAKQHNALYIPAGLAHGFLTLEENCEVFYQMGESYDAALARGVRWNDPAFAIEWPFPPEVMAERDANFPDFAT